MKVLKSIFIISLLIWPLGVSAQINDGYISWKYQALAELSKAPIDESGATTYAYRDITPEMRNLLTTRSEEALSFAKQHGKDPVLWWILGELGHIKRGLYQLDLVANGEPYVVDAPENQYLIQKYQSHYRKALDMDDRQEAPDRLNHSMLTSIGTDVLAVPDLKERALKKKVVLSQQGDVLYPNQEWFSYEFLLSNFVEQGDYDNYLKTVNEMMERFPNGQRMNELEEYKRQAEAAIEKRDREGELEGGSDVNISSTEPTQQQTSKVAKSESTQVAEPEEQSMLPWLLLGGGIAVIAVGAAFAARRRKRD